MKNNQHTAFIIIILFVFNIGCGIDDNKRDVIGTGDIVTQELTLNSFSSISIEGVANVYVDLGNSQSVSLSAQQNIIDVLNWDVIGTKLVIGVDDDVNIKESEEIRFDIVIFELSDIELSGAGNFDLEGQGTATLDINLTGVGSVQAYRMPVENCYINSTGVGDCKVYVNTLLDVTITGVGDVYYRGYPSTINQSITGVGALVNDN